MLDLNALLGQLTNSAAQRQQNVVSQLETMNADTAAMQDMMTVNTQEATQVAQTSADLAARTAAVEYARNKTMENAQAVLGLNPDDVNNQLATSMAEYNAAETQRKASKQQFDKLSQISLLDNPLGWLAAQLQLPQVAAQNNAAVDTRDAAAANIATRQQLLTAHRSAVTANTAAQVQQIKLDTAQNDLAAARIKIREAEIQNSSVIAGRKLQAYQLSDKLFDIESDLVNKQLTVGQYMMSLEERREARAERAAQSAERLAAKKAQAEDLAAFDVQLGRVSQFLGLQTPMTAELLKRMPDAKKKQAWIEAATTGQIGADLVGSLQFINANGNTASLRQNNPGVAAAAQNFAAGIDSYSGEVQRKARAEGKTPKPAELVAQANDAYTNDIIASASRPGTGNSLTSPRWDSVFNPYKAQHHVMLDEIKSGKLPLQNNALVKELQLLRDTDRNGTATNISSEQELTALKAVALQVKSGKLKIDEASQQVAEYYRLAAGKNRELYQYELFNLPPQTSYRGQIPGVGFLSNAVEVELMSPTSVKKSLLSVIRGTERELRSGILANQNMRYYDFGVSLSGPTGDVLRNSGK